jgi:ABC-type transport system involved in cytochrome bd biosynthesis fused ATPase/permease subunit
MEAGKIIEQGRHEELIRRHGLYWTMARHQLKLQDDVPGAPTSTASV